MLRHLAKLAWNRKRGNALLLLEIFFTFLVVFAVATGTLDLLGRLGSQPGFRVADVWSVTITTDASGDDFWSPEQTATMAQLLRETQSLPGVRSVAMNLSTPYDMGSRTSNVEDDQLPGGRLEMEVNEVSDDFAKVVDLEIVAGRFFDASDDGQTWRPVVIDRDLARARFGDGDPLGRSLDSEGHLRVVGVVREFRRSELSALGNYAFERVRVGNPEDRPPHNLLLRTEVGVGDDFEETLARRLHAAAPQWSFDVRPISLLRSDSLRLQMAPLVVGGLVAGFLLLMVALGLTGVLWQSMSRRTREIGLRRAIGASAAAIRRQLLAELLLLAGIALALGTVIVLQLPLLVSFLVWKEVIAALLLAIVAILALTTAAGWLPTRLATRLEPADALRYE
jgi:putative ABC transport system permease protein